MTRWGLVIIPCGGRKSGVHCAASALYRGAYYRGCLAYARSLVPDGSIRILSGLHGLLALSEVIAPYEMRLGEPGSICAGAVRSQAAAMGDVSPVLVVGGQEYVNMARAVWPQAASFVESLPKKKRGIGYQLQAMKRGTAI